MSSFLVFPSMGENDSWIVLKGRMNSETDDMISMKQVCKGANIGECAVVNTK